MSHDVQKGDRQELLDCLRAGAPAGAKLWEPDSSREGVIARYYWKISGDHHQHWIGLKCIGGSFYEFESCACEDGTDDPGVVALDRALSAASASGVLPADEDADEDHDAAHDLHDPWELEDAIEELRP